MANHNPPANGFKKGDPRINRNGRPKSFDQLRALAQQIAHETAKAGGNTVVIDGHSVTVAEAVIRQWFQSKEFAKQKAALEIAFGKVPDTVQHTGEGGGPIEHKVVVIFDGNAGNTSPADDNAAAGD